MERIQRPWSERVPDPRRLPTRAQAEFMAEAFIRRHGVTRAPIDVYELALAAGIIDVSEEDISKAAVTMSTPVGPVVLLRKRDIKTRKRFSLAHEIGHRILHPSYESVHELAPIAARHDYNRLESTVNHFAACLLMPRTWFVRELERDHDVTRLARTFDVSAAAAAARIRDVEGGPR